MEPIVIVGFSFRMPQDIVNEDDFWDVLEARKNLMTEWPEGRVLVDSFHDGGTKKANTLHGRGGYFFRGDPSVFDAPFFSITANEAASMDPQQRWALETTYHALENAGIAPESLRGSQTAVFGASMTDDYARMIGKDPDTVPRQAISGTAKSLVANRISWYFHLRGPSVHVDTACSSSMVALDMACQAMRSGDATAAVVVGTNALLTPDTSLSLGNMNFLSPDSKCFAFDARANGYSRGEGIVALVLKSLGDALKDGDVIRAVLRATGSNQDGRTPTLTQPSPEAQEALIRHTYAKAGLGFDETRFVEAHGTGTPVGDPIEMTAIGRVFRTHRSPDQPLLVGTVKSNIGHLEGASGLAGIIKSILILEKGIIPPNALFENMHPDIDADFYNVQVPVQSIPWPSSGLRRVSVNSFGFGGANAHAILDDAFHYLQSQGLAGYHHSDPPLLLTRATASQTAKCDAHPNGISSSGNGELGPDGHSRTPKLLVWSAADSGALQRMLSAYQDYFHANCEGDDYKLGQLAYTLAARRSILPWRTFAVVDAALGSLVNTEQENGGAPVVFPTVKAVRAPPGKNGIVFAFTGQGAQYTGMGLELMQYRAFEDSIRDSEGILTRLGCEWSVIDKIRTGERLDSPDVSQPLCTALQIALTELLRSFGVTPAAVVGHSSGEIAAAYAIGALSHESACKVAYCRGKVAGSLSTTTNRPGAMLSINLAESEIPAWLERSGVSFCDNAVHLACVNSPTNVTISGAAEAIDMLEGYFDKQGIFARKVNMGVAYHSPAMRAVAAEYLAMMGALEASPKQGSVMKPTIAMVSSVTGQIVPPKVLAASQYWVDNLVSPVRFVDALQHITSHASSISLPLNVEAITDLVEVGPHAALRRPVRDTIPESIRYHTVLERTKSPLYTSLRLLGSLFCHGYPVSVLAGNKQEGHMQFLVDCPRYPFDRSRQYWSEPRMSKDFRLRQDTPGFLIGKRAYDWNELQPRWRNWLSIDGIPWLGDHVISGTTVCPGAGMLVMAIEAISQVIAANGRNASGFHIKDAHFSAPVIVNETEQEATETELHLRPMQQAHEKESSRFEISIYSHHSDRWTKCFSANIIVEFQDSNKNTVRHDQEIRLFHDRIRNHVEVARLSCSKSISSQAFYKFCEEHGTHYGESFRLLREIGWDGKRISFARAETTATRWDYRSSSPVHPTVLDALMQLILTQLSKGLSDPATPTVVPQQVSNMWISATNWHQGTRSVYLSSTLRSIDARTMDIQGAIYAVCEDGSPLCAIENLTLAGVSRSVLTDRLSAERSLLHNILWRPRLSSLCGKQLQLLCDAGVPARDEAAIMSLYPKMELAMRMAGRKARQAVTTAELDRAPKHLRKYVASMEHRYSLPLHGGSEPLNDAALEDFLRDCEDEDCDWRLFPAIARALPSILRGETDPLELMFGSKDAEKFYSRIVSDHMSDGRLRTFLELASHENPAQKILEIGAGTGGLTRHILGTLHGFETEEAKTSFAEYTYTDISSAFFEAARELFSGCRDRMRFKTLDIEQEPTKEGFELGSYDMVVAGNVLHATSDLAATLRNVRSLLKPGGQLVLWEVTSPNSESMNVAFGSIEGWWNGTEAERKHGPLITEQRWGELLHETGFSGTTLLLRDYQSDVCHFSSIIVSIATEVKPNGTGGNDASHYHHHELVALIDPESDTQRSLVTKIRETHPNLQVINLAQVDQTWTTSSTAVVVSLLEIDAPHLATLSETHFLGLQQLMRGMQNLLWVTSSSVEDNAEASAYFALATGFLRSIRSEENNKHTVTLDIESFGCTQEATQEADYYILEVLQSCFWDKTGSPEVEFIVRNGHLYIGRLMREVELDEERVSRETPRAVTQAWKLCPPLVLDVGTPGLLDTLQFVEDPTLPELGPDEVEIEAETWPIGFRDVLVGLGRLGDEGMGFECAGKVTRVGTACAEFKSGERVMILAAGCMRTYPRAPAHSVFKIPDGLSTVEAASAASPLATAYHALVNVARLERGERILIHAAAGGTSQMAVRVAQLLGAVVYATVGSGEKKELLIRDFGLSEEHIFYSRDTSFARSVMRVTEGEGVDVVFNSLSGESLRSSWECMAPHGRFIEIGKMDIRANAPLPMASFAKNVSFAAVDLVHLAQTKHQLTRHLIEKTFELAAKDKVGVPRPLHVYPVSDIEAAFRYIQSGKNTGRTIITLRPDDTVTAFILNKSTWKFDAEASYIIAGGLGGLGRFILRWMASKGARNLIAPSPKGLSTQAAIDVVSELSKKGVHVVAPSCDVSSASQLSAVLDECAATMPPIKGCINAAMILQDAVFGNMTHAQWTQTIQSKVSTSWNLHQLLPDDMSFFILLSSIAGVYGTLAQCNYAAGCTFQDALARLRTGAGHSTSISLDLGWMRTIGIIAENEEYRRHRQEASDMAPVEAEDLLAILEHYCNPFLAPLDTARSQLLVGAITPAHFHARGEKPIPIVTRPLFSGYQNAHLATIAHNGTMETAQQDPSILFQQASSHKDRCAVVAAAIRAKLARALGVAIEDIEPEKGSLSDYGTDSLMAIELRNWIRRDFGADVAVFDIMGEASIVAVGELVATRAAV